jgi:hypothetical protein
MPAKDIYRDNVKKALIKDGWTITHDPYSISVEFKSVFVDLGAERVLAAEKENEKIAIEVKTFRGASDIVDFEQAVGQYVFYRSLIGRTQPERKLFLAIPIDAYETTFQEPIIRPALEDLNVALFVFDPKKEVILKWIP